MPSYLCNLYFLLLALLSQVCIADTITHHDLKVTLLPSKGEIEVEDVISLQNKTSEITFRRSPQSKQSNHHQASPLHQLMLMTIQHQYRFNVTKPNLCSQKINSNCTTVEPLNIPYNRSQKIMLVT